MNRREMLGMALTPLVLPTYSDIEHLRWRDEFLQINAEFRRLFGQRPHEEVNCGRKPNDGTGDLIEVALRKVRDNLRLVKHIGLQP